MECKLNIQNMQKYANFAKYAVAPAAFICIYMQEYASYVHEIHLQKMHKYSSPQVCSA